MNFSKTMVTGSKKDVRLLLLLICCVMWCFSQFSRTEASELGQKFIGTACSSDRDCMALYITCSNGVCSCDPTFTSSKIPYFIVAACKEDRKLGDLCSSDEECKTPHSHCSVGNCECDSGYIKELRVGENVCAKYEGKNNDVRVLETRNSPTYEHMKFELSKWPLVAAIVVVLLILTLCIYFCFRRCKSDQQQGPQQQQQQAQSSANYQSCPQASGPPVVTGALSQQMNYLPYPLASGYGGGPPSTSGLGGSFPVGGYVAYPPSGTHCYYGTPRPGGYQGYPPVLGYPGYSSNSQTEQYQGYPPVSGPPVYGNPPQMANYMCPPYATHSAGFSECFQPAVPFPVSGASYPPPTAFTTSPVHPSAPPDNGENRQDSPPLYCASQGLQEVQPK
ncbi:uncharacterized protein LOC111086643 isoform X2 [Limulus polyphemus]|nr:uncharacterized protein LOC111086643 isoform X2 [Limulus polyphemus]XP_022246043.1 uncharacterized protein LOC111086643 isoform X2 [Limulus polyphemus]